MPKGIEIGRSRPEHLIQLNPYLKNYMSQFAEKRDEARGYPRTPIQIYPEFLRSSGQEI